MINLMKDFNSWNSRKIHIDICHKNRFYKERDIWWCSLGLNIGSEQDGKDIYFQRPILIIKSFGPRICFVVPLTTSEKSNILRFHLGVIDGKNSSALLSQVRVIDTKRLVNKIAVLNNEKFNLIRKAIKEIL